MMMIKERKIEDLTSDIVCRELSYYIRYHRYYVLPYDRYNTAYSDVKYNKEGKQFYIETIIKEGYASIPYTICGFIHWADKDDRDETGAIHFKFEVSLPLDLQGLVLDFYRKECDNNGNPKLNTEGKTNE